MSSVWIPLPFPRCPSCHSSWVRCYHRDCYTGGEILVEPYLKQARCEGCSLQWHVMDTTFYCSCGYVFHASEVDEALYSFSVLKDRLIQQIRDMDRHEKMILRSSEDSLLRWVDQVAYEVGRLLGTTIGVPLEHLRRLLRRLLG